jgi:hypothetical protein
MKQLNLRFTHVNYQVSRMPSSGMLRRVALVRTDVLEELGMNLYFFMAWVGC